MRPSPTNIVDESEKSASDSLLFNQALANAATPDTIPSYTDILFNNRHHSDKATGNDTENGTKILENDSNDDDSGEIDVTNNLDDSQNNLDTLEKHDNSVGSLGNTVKETNLMDGKKSKDASLTVDMDGNGRKTAITAATTTVTSQFVADNLMTNNVTEEHEKLHQRQQSRHNTNATSIFRDDDDGDNHDDYDDDNGDDGDDDDDDDDDDSYMPEHTRPEKTSTSASTFISTSLNATGLSEQEQRDTKAGKKGDEVEAKNKTTEKAAPMSKNAKRRKRLLKELGDVEIRTNPRKIKRLEPPAEITKPATTTHRIRSSSLSSTSSSTTSTKRGHPRERLDSFQKMDDIAGLSDEEDEGSEYEVEAIRRHKTYRNHVLRYEVKWKGYPESENTFEPASSFHEDCTELCVQYWLSLPSDILRPQNLPRGARAIHGDQQYPSAPKMSSNNSTTVRSPIAPPTPSGSTNLKSYTPNMSSFSSSEVSVSKAKEKQRALIDVAGVDDFNNDDDIFDIGGTFDMDSDDGMNADSYVPSKLDKHITHNSSNLYDDEADDFNDDDYDGSANRKQATRFDTDLFGKLYEPESPDTPTNSNSSNKKHATSSSKPTPTTTIPMPTTTTTAIGIEPYVRFAKENGITRRSIATNYKNTGFELAYSRDIVPVTRKFDWAKEDFTIQNILPLKNNRSQLLAYLVWPNEIKTVHIIQELHDKCSKKLCRYYESRIKYT